MLIENKILPKRISDLYEDLIDNSYQKISLKEKKVIYQSLVIAYNGHDGQMRKSGEPYIHDYLKNVQNDINSLFQNVIETVAVEGHVRQWLCKIPNQCCV